MFNEQDLLLYEQVDEDDLEYDHGAFLDQSQPNNAFYTNEALKYDDSLATPINTIDNNIDQSELITIPTNMNDVVGDSILRRRHWIGYEAENANFVGNSGSFPSASFDHVHNFQANNDPFNLIFAGDEYQATSHYNNNEELYVSKHADVKRPPFPPFFSGGDGYTRDYFDEQPSNENLQLNAYDEQSNLAYLYDDQFRDDQIYQQNEFKERSDNHNAYYYYGDEEENEEDGYARVDETAAKNFPTSNNDNRTGNDEHHQLHLPTETGDNRAPLYEDSRFSSYTGSDTADDTAAGTTNGFYTGAGDCELLCDASNISVDMALRHGRRGPTTKICEYCGLFLRHPSKIAAHMRTHTGERPFTCEFCGQDFSQRTPYRMHVKRHIGDLPFFCSFCNKKFPSNASRNGHEIRVHHKLRRQGAPQPHLKPVQSQQSTLSPDDAAVDGKLSTAAASTHSHSANWRRKFGEFNGKFDADEVVYDGGGDSAHHRNMSAPTTSGVNNNPRRASVRGAPSSRALDEYRSEDRHPPTVAQCTDCGLIFKHPSKIQAHMRTHTGEKPFVCADCGLGCSTNSALRVHIRRFHTGERPHECTWDCGRRFVSVAARNEHERIVHAGIKRYQCTVGDCRRLFTRRSYMVKHLQSHTNEIDNNSAPHINSGNSGQNNEQSYLRLSVPSNIPLKDEHPIGNMIQSKRSIDEQDEVDSKRKISMEVVYDSSRPIDNIPIDERSNMKYSF